MIGQKLSEVFSHFPDTVSLNYFAIKQSVFPFEKFPGVDIILGPEMRSTGEVMGIAKRFGEAFAKGQLGIGMSIPSAGKAFLSVRDEDKPGIPEIARQLRELGFELLATQGTAKVLDAAGIACVEVNKVWEGRPNIVDLIINKEIAFIVNTSKGRKSARIHPLCVVTLYYIKLTILRL